MTVSRLISHHGGHLNPVAKLSVKKGLMLDCGKKHTSVSVLGNNLYTRWPPFNVQVIYTCVCTLCYHLQQMLWTAIWAQSALGLLRKIAKGYLSHSDMHR